MIAEEEKSYIRFYLKLDPGQTGGGDQSWVRRAAMLACLNVATLNINASKKTKC